MTKKIQISPDDYKFYLKMILQDSLMCQPVPAKDILNAMNFADSIGPIIDPTLWINAHATMDVQRQVVEAYHEFQQKIGKIIQKHGLEKMLEAIASS